MFTHESDSLILAKRLIQLKYYKLDLGGICTGLAYVAKQSKLSGEWEHYNKRIALINSIPEAEFRARYKSIKKEWLALVKQIKEEAKQAYKKLSKQEKLLLEDDQHIKKILFDLSSDHTLSILEINKRKKQLIFNLFLQRRIDAELQKMSEDKRLQLEIPAFFDGIVLYQDTYSYRHLFSEGQAKILKTQDADLGFSLISPKKLEGKNSKVDHVFSGIYSKDDLAVYFYGLKQILLQSNLSDPFSLVLYQPGHRITVGYDPRIKKWLFCNAGYIEPIDAADVVELAEKVKQAFTKNDYAAFVTEVDGELTSQSELNNCIHAWKNLASFNHIHDVKSKVGLTDSYKNTWLLSAVRANDISTVNLLLQNGADVNATNSNGQSAIILAAKQGQTDMVQLLLDNKYNKADPNAGIGKSVTPLYAASMFGRLEIVKLLLKYQANPNAIYENGTPLYVAAGEGHGEVVEYLIDHGADQHLYSNGNGSPIYVAVLNHRTNIVEFSLKKRLIPILKMLIIAVCFFSRPSLVILILLNHY